MFILGTVGAREVRSRLQAVARRLVGDSALSVETLGETWVVSSSPPVAGRWQVGPDVGPHAWVRAVDDGAQLGGDPWSYWPLYYARLDGGVVFGTLLKPLVEVLRPGIDFAGCCQKAMIGTTLGTRTRYEGIERRRPGTTLRVHRSGTDFDERPFWREPIPGDAAALATLVRSNVQKNLGSARKVIALLSGGLDSRVVVSLLREVGCEVTAINFGAPGNQDEVFARQFAALAGVDYHSMPRREGERGLFRMAAERIAQQRMTSDMPNALWTGLGASNLLGAVHLTEPMIEHLRNEEFELAAREHCAVERYSLPQRLFTRDAKALEQQVVSAIVNEFEHYRTVDPGHSFALYVLFNRERSGAAAIYEEITRHGLAVTSPFIDEEILRRALAFDPAYLLRHRFYHDWLEQLPENVRTVPWQVYPGHLECPIPVATSMPDQWRPAGGRRQRISDVTRKEAFSVLFQRPKQLRMTMIALALALEATGLRNSPSLLRSAAAFRA